MKTLKNKNIVRLLILISLIVVVGLSFIVTTAVYKGTHIGSGSLVLDKGIYIDISDVSSGELSKNMEMPIQYYLDKVTSETNRIQFSVKPSSEAEYYIANPTITAQESSQAFYLRLKLNAQYYVNGSSTPTTFSMSASEKNTLFQLFATDSNYSPVLFNDCFTADANGEYYYYVSGGYGVATKNNLAQVTSGMEISLFKGFLANGTTPVSVINFREFENVPENVTNITLSLDIELAIEPNNWNLPDVTLLTENDVTVSLVDNEYEITKINTSATSYALPGYYQGNAITRIGTTSPSALDDDAITVWFANTMTHVGGYRGVSTLQKIYLGNNVSEICDSAFGYSGLTGNLVLPISIQKIGKESLGDLNTTGLFPYIPNCMSYGLGAFKNDAGFTGTLTIRGEIYEHAFKDMSGIDTLKISSGTTLLENDPHSDNFAGMSSLKKVFIDSSAVAGLASSGSGLLENENLTDVYIKSDLTIGAYFANHSNFVETESNVAGYRHFGRSYQLTFNGGNIDGTLDAKLWNYAGSAGYSSSNSGNNGKYTFSGKNATTRIGINGVNTFYLPMPIISGYTFDGWYTTANGSSETVKVATADGWIANVSGYTSENGSWIRANVTTLYAHYTKKEYSISYDFAGGSKGTNAPTSYIFGNTTAISNPTRKGYLFTGWNISVSLTGRSLATIDINTGVQEYVASYPNAVYYELFYAHQGISYTAALSGGQIRWIGYTTAGAYSSSLSSSSNYTLSSDAYVALWYHLGKEDNNTIYEYNYIGDNLSIDSLQVGNLTLTAKWKPITYTIKYDGNGNTGGSTANSSHTYDQAKALTANSFSKTGYTFAGWATSKTGAVVYTNKQSVTNLSSTQGDTITLYAKWTANTYTVTYEWSLTDKGWMDQNINYSPRFTNWSVSGTTLNVSITGQGGWETKWLCFYGEAGHQYTWTFGYTMPASCGMRVQILNSQPGNNNGQNAQVNTVSGSGYLDLAKGATGTATLNFTPSTTGNYYLNLNFGYLTDNVAMNLSFTNIKLQTTRQVTYDSTYSSMPTTRNSWVTGYNNLKWTNSSGTTITSSTKVTTASNHTLSANLDAVERVITFDSMLPVPWKYLYLNSNTNGTFVANSANEYVFTYNSSKDPSISAGPHIQNLHTYMTNGERYRITVSIKSSAAITLPMRFEASSSSKNIDVTTSYQTFYLDFTYDNTTTWHSFTFYSSSWVNGQTMTFKDLKLSRLATVNSAYDTLPSPTKEGYTFDGWWTTSDNSGIQITKDSICVTYNRTLYAHWTENTTAYLMTGSNWQEKLKAANSNYTQANIESIEFTKTKPTSGTRVSVGAINADGTSAYVAGTSGVSDVFAYVTAGSTSGKYKVVFYSNATIYAPVDSSSLFSDPNFSIDSCLTNLISISFANFNTSNVTNMLLMFSDCSSLTSLNLSNFNTSNVTNMLLMFSDCSSLTSLNLSSFNTSNVTNMQDMFYNCSSLTSLNLSNFNTSKVTNMFSMFSDCSSLTSLNLSNFNTSNVTNMQDMFYNCSSLTSLDISSFNTSKVTNMNDMFANCSKLRSLNLSNFDMSKVTTLAPGGTTPTISMFYECSSLTEIKTPKAIGRAAVNLPAKNGYSWLDKANTNNAYTQITSACLSKTLVLRENNSYLRKDWATALKNNNANFKQENIKTIQFVKSIPSGSGYTQVSVGATASDGATAFAAGTAGVSDIIAYVKANSSDSTKYDIIFYSPVTIYAPVNSRYLFSNSTTANRLTKLTSISFGNFNTSNVTNMSYMFSYCSSLTSLNLSSFNTSNVTDMNKMFNECSSLTSLNLSGFDTSNVTDMSFMFRFCSKLTSLNLSNFNTSNVTNMSVMFAICKALTSLNLSNFNTSNVTDMSSMFSSCESLTSLNVSSFNTSNVTNMNSMFFGCSKFTSLNVSNFNTSNVTDMGSMFPGCSKLTSLNLSNFNTSKVTNMDNMFNACSSLTSLNLSSFDTSNVTELGVMFANCSSLTSLNLSNFNTSKVTYMYAMFGFCTKLTSLNLSSFDMSKVTNTTDMFKSCSALTTIYTPKTMGSTTVDLPGTLDSLHAWYKSTDSNRYTPYTTISSSNTNSTLNLRVAMRTITITWGSDSNGNGNWAFDAQWNGSVQVSSSQGGTQSGTRTFRVEATTSIQCSFWIKSPTGLIWHKTGSVSISGTCTNSNFGSNTAPNKQGEAHRTAYASNFKSDITISFYFSASK